MNQQIGSETQSVPVPSTAFTEDLRRLGEDVKHVASRGFHQGRQRVVDLENSVAGYVRERPMTCLAMVAGAGMLLGFVLGRRR